MKWCRSKGEGYDAAVNGAALVNGGHAVGCDGEGDGGGGAAAVNGAAVAGVVVVVAVVGSGGSAA
jgi:hypothetical protein